MTNVPVQPPSPAEFTSTRGVVANSAHADHFAQLLAGMKVLSADEVKNQSIVQKPGSRDEFGAELFKDIHGLDKVMEGMDVATKLNSKVLESGKDEMAEVSETLMRMQVDGTTYFMQTNFINQRLGELEEHLKAVTRSR